MIASIQLLRRALGALCGAVAVAVAAAAPANAGTGACGVRFIAPAAASYTAASGDDGTLISAANATGPATGWAAASLPVNLPAMNAITAPWTLCGTTDANKAVVFDAPLMAAPAAPSLSAANGGTLVATTYYVKLTYVNLAGETVASGESTLAVGANQLLVVASPAAPPAGSATGYNVYVSSASGTETKQNAAAIALGTNWTEPLGGLISGAAPPAIGTAPSAYILDGGQSLASYVLGTSNGQTAAVLADGTNYRVIWTSQESRRINGATADLPTRWVYPGGPGYQATQGDNGNEISSALSTGLTVTLPSTTAIAAGWSVGLRAAAGQALTVVPNATSGGQLVLADGRTFSAPSTYPLPPGGILPLQFDGANFLELGRPAVPHVATNAALQALAGSTGASAVRDGFYAAYDGAGAITYQWQAAACVGGADNGARVAATAGGCWVANLAGLRLTPLIWGAKGDGITDDHAAIQAAITTAQNLGAVAYFDNLHRYSRGTTTINVTAPVDIEGPVFYSGWTAGNLINATPTCPGGIIANRTGTTALNVTAIAVTIRNLCIEQTSGTGSLSDSAGAAISVAPPLVTNYQAGLRITNNTILRPYDGIEVNGAGYTAACCGAGTTADGNQVSWNTIIAPAGVGISNGKNTASAATSGISYIDNYINCGNGADVLTTTGAVTSGSALLTGLAVTTNIVAGELITGNSVPALATTGNLTSGSNQLTSLASTTGIVAGQAISDSLKAVPAGTTVSSISGTTVTMSANATASATGVPVIFGVYTIPLGTRVVSISGTTVTMDHNANATVASIGVDFSERGIGFALYDGDIKYDGTTNGPLGCAVNFEMVPGTVSGVGQNVGGIFTGVMGDQPIWVSTLIQPQTSLGIVGFVQGYGVWNSGGLISVNGVNVPSGEPLLIDNTNNGNIQEIAFTAGSVFHGNGQPLQLAPIVHIHTGTTGGASTANFVFTGDMIDHWPTGVAATNVQIDGLAPTLYPSRMTFSGNHIGNAPGGQAANCFAISGAGTGYIAISGNDVSECAQPLLVAGNIATGLAGTLYVSGNVGITPAVISQTTLANYGTTSLTPIMAGYGATVAITPKTTGKIAVSFTGYIANSVLGDGGFLSPWYGTGTAPAAGVATTGTQCSNSVAMTTGNANQSVPFALNCTISGLTLNTSYWLDLATEALTGGTFTIYNATIEAHELQ